MLMYNNGMGIVSKEVHSGFTIIEVMLFLALSGFMLLGIFVGTNSSIANQRYKDAVQDAADALKKAYSFVADTQIEEREGAASSCNWLTDSASQVDINSSESGRGRTSCAVYGAVVTIRHDLIQTTTLIGLDYYDMLLSVDQNGKGNSDYEGINSLDTSDIDLLGILQANNIAKHCDSSGNNCTTAVAGNSSTQKLRWEARFKKPNDASGSNRDLELTLLIYRSPRDGSIHTLSMDGVIENNNAWVDYRNLGTNASPSSHGVYRYIKDKKFQQKDVYFCIDSGGAGTYANHNRIVHIIKNAQSQSGIILENLDDDITDNAGNSVSCDEQ